MEEDNYSGYTACPRCGHDRNRTNYQKCEICGSELQKRGSKLPLVFGIGLLSTALIGAATWLIWPRQSNPDTVQSQAVSADPNPTQPVALTTPLPDANSSQSDVDTTLSQLRILGDTFSGYSTFRNPEFQATLNQVELVYDDEFDQAARATSLGQGEADLIVTTLDQFLRQRPEGQIVALIDRTVGADAVVLNTPRFPGLTSLGALNNLVANEREQGRSLAMSYATDTPSEYLALVLDTAFDDFRLADFELKPVEDASDAWALLQNPEERLAIAIIWEPYVTQARQQGYTVVLSSEDTPTSIVDVLVAADDLIANQPELVREFVEAYYRRIDANVRDASELQRQIAADADLSDAEAAAVLQGIEFFTAIEARDWLSDGTLRQRIQAIAAVLTLSGRLNSPPANPEALYTDRFVAAAARTSETLIELVRADNPALADRLAGRTRAITPVLSASDIAAAPAIGNLQVTGEVQFATGSADLTDLGRQTLTQLKQEIQEFNPATVAVRVIGHTSRTGAADFNQILSQQRAQVVVDFFRSKGLTHNLLAEGRGFDEPLPDVDPSDSRNQRTEIRLVRVN